MSDTPLQAYEVTQDQENFYIRCNARLSGHVKQIVGWWENSDKRWRLARTAKNFDQVQYLVSDNCTLFEITRPESVVKPKAPVNPIKGFVGQAVWAQLDPLVQEIACRVDHIQLVPNLLRVELEGRLVKLTGTRRSTDLSFLIGKANADGLLDDREADLAHRIRMDGNYFSHDRTPLETDDLRALGALLSASCLFSVGGHDRT